MIRFLTCTFLAVFSTWAHEGTHEYKQGEPVYLWVNKVGPFNNPTETYPYYDSHVPFCKRATEFNRDHAKLHWNKADGIGSLLEGNNLVNSGIPVKFMSAQPKALDCTLTLTPESAKELRTAIQQKYWYRMYLDDLPLWGMVGEMLPEASDTAKHSHGEDLDALLEEEHALAGDVKRVPHVFTLKAFSISYNKNRVIHVNLTSETPVPVKDLTESGSTQKIPMAYSVKWTRTQVPFSRRFDRYLDFQFFEHQIHFFSLFNSFMLVLFLIGVVVLVLFRMLRKDYDRIAAEDEIDLEYEKVMEETGWKRLHGDVFREPEHLEIFAAVIGTGYQIYFSALLVILLALSGKLYDGRGSIASATLFTYAASAFVAGYTSSQTFCEYGGVNNPEWKQCMLITGTLYPAGIFIVCSALNTLAWMYKVTNAVSFGVICMLAGIYVVSLVLLLLGTLLGRKQYKHVEFPCKVSRTYTRPIPDDRPWYMNPPVLCMFGGVLPFGSVFIEVYYILNSYWNYKFYYVYGFMLVVFVILTLTVSCVTVLAVYFLLNNEDRRWKWMSVFASGSTGAYIFAYTIFYFFTKTHMTGVFQTVYYFGVMFLFSLAVSFLCGTIGFVASSIFVWRIYSDIHFD